MGNCSIMDNRLLPSEVTLNRFSLQYIIGKGGFGEVWKAYDNYNKNYCAIKIMSKAKILNYRSVGLIMKERHILSLLNST